MARWLRRALGILAVGGGGTGVAIGLQAIFSTTSVAAWVVGGIFVCLYGWGIWCGVRMFERGADAAGMNLVFWAIQIPLVQSRFFTYVFTSGFYLSATFQPSNTNFNFRFQLGSQFGVWFMQPGKPFVFGINLFALAIAVLLFRYWRRRPPSAALQSAPSDAVAAEL